MCRSNRIACIVGGIVAILCMLTAPSFACDTLGVCAQQQVYAAPLVQQVVVPQYVQPLAIQAYAAPIVQRQVVHAAPIVQRQVIRQHHVQPVIQKQVVVERVRQPIVSRSVTRQRIVTR